MSLHGSRTPDGRKGAAQADAPHDGAGGHTLAAVGPALVMLAFALVIARRWQDGALDLYVYAGMTPWVAASAIVLVSMAAAQLATLVRRDEGASHAHGLRLSWGAALIGAAALVAGLLPARPLGSALVESGAGEILPPAAAQLTDETADWTLLEWAQALAGGARRERLVGRTVSVVGFVHRSRQTARSGEFQVTRFVVRCCAADGLAVSLPVRFAEADSLRLDTWVHVDGLLRLSDDASAVYVDADRVQVVPEPASPYLTAT